MVTILSGTTTLWGKRRPIRLTNDGNTFQRPWTSTELSDDDSSVSTISDDPYTQDRAFTKQRYADIFDSNIDPRENEWRLKLYQKWRLFRKQALGAERVEHVVAAQELPAWFWKFRHPDCDEGASDQSLSDLRDTDLRVWEKFDDDLSDLDVQCVCVEEGPGMCCFHAYVEPKVDLSTPQYTKALFLRRHRQREWRKVELQLGVGRWFHKRRASNDMGGGALDEMAKMFQDPEDFEVDLSDLEEECSCPDRSIDDSCGFHREKLAQIKGDDRYPKMFYECWKKREDAKLHFRARDEAREQYQFNVEQQEERSKEWA